MLENNNVIYKVSNLQGYRFKCAYSEMIFGIVRKFIDENDDIKMLQSNISEDSLNMFFEDKFIRVYVEYINLVFEKLVDKFRI